MTVADKTQQYISDMSLTIFFEEVSDAKQLSITLKKVLDDYSLLLIENNEGNKNKARQIALLRALEEVLPLEQQVA